MPASEAFAGFGTQFQVEDGATPPAYTTIAEIRDITLPNQTRDVIDVTHMASPGNAEEVIVGLLRTGEASFEMNWVPSNTLHGASGLYGFMVNGTKKNYRIILNDPDATEIDFAAFVTAFGGNAPLNDAVRSNVTLKVTGPLTITTGP